jgi:hypothetical protein
MAVTPLPSSFDRIFADVRKDLPSVPDAIVRQEIFRVIDDFSQHTNVWQEQVFIDILPQTWSYNFVVQQGQPNRLLTMYDAPLNLPAPAPPPTSFWPDGPAFMRVPGIIQLSRVPITASRRAIVVAKRPLQIEPTNFYPLIDDWIVDKYADTLGRGILARLQIQPQKPWSNPMLAQPNQRAYISGRSEARINDEHANTLNASNWKFPQTWATVTRKGWA